MYVCVNTQCVHKFRNNVLSLAAELIRFSPAQIVGVYFQILYAALSLTPMLCLFGQKI